MQNAMTHRMRAMTGLTLVTAWCAGTAYLAAGPRAEPRAAATQSAAPATRGGAADHTGRAFISTYCLTCHNERAKTAGLSLEKANPENPAPDAEAWEKVIRKLRVGAMPPAGQPRPAQDVTAAFMAGLEQSLDRAAQANPDPGRRTIHRLNRVEYTNAIRDLLALQIDGEALLPADNTGYGFDNIADVLSFSPSLLDRYLLAAQKISRLAIGDPEVRAFLETYHFPYAYLQEARRSNDLPAGSRGGVVLPHYFPSDGEYVIRVRLQRERNGALRGLDEPNQLDIRLDGERVKVFPIGNETVRLQYSAVLDDADSGLEVRLPVTGGPHAVGVTFQGRTWVADGVGPSRLPVASSSFANAVRTSEQFGRVEAGVDSVEIEGPFTASLAKETPSRRRIFMCRPARPGDELACARTILSTLAYRAFRRPLLEDDIAGLLRFYDSGRTKGGFDEGIGRALEAILIDPEFLFRVERDPPRQKAGTLYSVSGFELAARLSFFLWSSIPDDELLELARQNRLHQPAVLEAQVRRMLKDARATALVDGFFGQWLSVRSLTTVAPDPQAFPEFDENLREAFERETKVFLEHQLLEDRSALELLTADYSFVNERLARHYGMRGVVGSHFRRVPLSDGRRGGILGHGSVLTVTSYAHRTSPVGRGKWILETLLGTPPPPPPANVPPLEENNKGGAPTSVRERMERHRRNPVCANCHARLDPLGFSLENFDGIGQWRTSDGGKPVDASGVFPNGMTFDGPAAFRQALVGNRDAFVSTLVERLLTYALGRGVEHSDMPVVRSITRGAARDGYRWSSLFVEIVKSMPFQMRRAQS